MKLLRIKWENIVAILIGFIFTYYNVQYIFSEDFMWEILVMELMLDLCVITAWIYIAKRVRWSFLEL